jgi:hypothetical protein
MEHSEGSLCAENEYDEEQRWERKLQSLIASYTDTQKPSSAADIDTVAVGGADRATSANSSGESSSPHAPQLD